MESIHASGSSATSPSAEQIGARLTKAKRATVACTACRKRQVRCQKAPSGPDCQRCLKMGLKCEYIPLNVQRGTSSAEDPMSAAVPLGSHPELSAYASARVPQPPSAYTTRTSPISPGGLSMAEQMPFTNPEQSSVDRYGVAQSSAPWAITQRPTALRVTTDASARSFYSKSNMPPPADALRRYPAPMPVSVPIAYSNTPVGDYRSYTPSPSSTGMVSPATRMGSGTAYPRTYTPSPTSSASWVTSQQQSPLVRSTSPWAASSRPTASWASAAGETDTYSATVVPPQLWAPTPTVPSQIQPHGAQPPTDPANSAAQYHAQNQNWYEPAAVQGMPLYANSPTAGAPYDNSTQEWQRRHSQY